MRSPRYVHVGINYRPGAAELQAVDQAVDSEAYDWLRYSINCYLVWTPSDCETISRKILRVPGLEDKSVFIAALDMDDAFGFLPTWCWDWIRKDRGFGAIVVWDPEHPQEPFPQLSAPPKMTKP